MAGTLEEPRVIMLILSLCNFLANITFFRMPVDSCERITTIEANTGGKKRKRVGLRDTLGKSAQAFSS